MTSTTSDKALPYVGDNVALRNGSQLSGAGGGIGDKASDAHIVIAHDYLTQRGGAERTVLAMARACPGAPIVTSLYESDSTFPEFSDYEVRTSLLQRSSFLRHHHRFAAPLYAPVFARMHIDADVVICSTSGWAHGVTSSGRRILYVYNTARWLYQVNDYLRDYPPIARSTATVLGAPLRHWDRVHGGSADLVLADSQIVRTRLAQHWGVDAKVLYPPHAANPLAEQHAAPDLDPGFLLAVSRLVPHKHVDVLIAAMEKLPTRRLVVVGSGPDAQSLRAAAPANCTFLERVTDARLRWLYANCSAYLSAAVEDLGLAAIEAMAFGRPAVTLRAAGFLETVVEGETGVFFDHQEPNDVARAVRCLDSAHFEAEHIAAHAQQFDEAHFAEGLRRSVEEVLT